MKALASRYLNEIVGLAVLGLMTVALIAGQADARSNAAAQGAGGHEAGHLSARIEAVTKARTIRADLDIQLDLDRLIDAASGETASAQFRDFVRINTISVSADGAAAE